MESPLKSAIQPVHPPAAYIGGKRRLASRICDIIARIPHRQYVEPFVGMGGVFLRRRESATVEVINDINRDVVTLFRVLQEHYPYFIDFLRFRVASRAEFDRLRRMDPNAMTDLQRAARFLYLQKLAFGGKVTSQAFGVDPRSASRFNVTRLEPLLSDIHTRLAGVIIECLPYAEVLRRYDRPETLFYLDPPYWASEDDYGAGVFGPEDFARLAEQLARIKGRFILSINDVPQIREAFAGLHLLPVATKYAISTKNHGGAMEAAELLISNLPLPAND